MWSALRSFLWDLFRFKHGPSKIYLFGIMPGVCFTVAVNLMFLIGYLADVHFSLVSPKFVVSCILLWLAVWMNCYILFAGYKITDEKAGKAFAKIFSP